jgi:hypothetical protein
MNVVTYDETGLVDYMDIFKDAQDAYTNLTIAAGECASIGTHTHELFFLQV